MIHLFRLPTQVISAGAFLSEGTAGLHVQFCPQQQKLEWVVALVGVSAQPERGAVGAWEVGGPGLSAQLVRQGEREGGVRVPALCMVPAVGFEVEKCGPHPHEREVGALQTGEIPVELLG